MPGLNKGEWNEFYTVLYFLVNTNIDVADSNLQVIDSTIFEINKLITQGETSLIYQKIDNNIVVFNNNQQIGKVGLECVIKTKEYLLQVLCNGKKLEGGSIELPSIDKFANDFTNGHSIKGKAKSKADIGANVIDKKLRVNIDLTYSIKSQFGSPATLLNASNHTNFRYRINGFDKKSMKIVNGINTRKKLLDRIYAINKLGGIIEFDKIVSRTLENNIKLIDSSMDKLIANALLYSYTNNEKDLKKAFFKSNPNNRGIFLRKKLIDFLYGMCFGFFPSENWNGKFSVTGGIMITKKTGNIVLLDKIYHNDSLEEYLYNSSKFDSPSTKRYHMLEIFEDNGEFFFTLNLQIRSKE